LVPSQVTLVAGDGLTLSCLMWGPAEPTCLPVVLLHGLTSRAEHWDRVARHLAVRRRVIAWDARGHGASQWAEDADYTVEAHFADVASALNGLGIARCALVGYSMGGSVAILTAAALPERVARLVVVDSYPAPEMTPGSRRIAEWVARSYLSSRDGGWEPRPDGLEREHRRFDPAIARRLAEELASGRPRRADLWPFWETLECPVLLVRGELSQVLPEPLAWEMVARQPRARLVTIPSVAHPIPFARPVELAELIEAFLNEGCS
jgi:esterase